VDTFASRLDKTLKELRAKLEKRALAADLTQSVFNVVLDKSTPPQIRQLIFS
jgi:hypothetical protein